MRIPPRRVCRPLTKMEIAILIWVVCGIAAAIIASSRGAHNGAAWYLVGFLLGPIGLFMAFSAGSVKLCESCRSQIPEDATRCPKCQAEQGLPRSSSAEDQRTRALVAALQGNATPEDLQRLANRSG